MCRPSGSAMGIRPSLRMTQRTADVIYEQGGTMYFVYILTNQTDKVMYIGVTNDLSRRLYEHKSEQIEGFTKRYHVNKLVYFEEYTEINDAIAREKQLKRWIRAKKNNLVETKNPNWKDFGEFIL